MVGMSKYSKKKKKKKKKKREPEERSRPFVPKKLKMIDFQ